MAKAFVSLAERAAATAAAVAETRALISAVEKTMETVRREEEAVNTAKRAEERAIAFKRAATAKAAAPAGTRSFSTRIEVSTLAAGPVTMAGVTAHTYPSGETIIGDITISRSARFKLLEILKAAEMHRTPLEPGSAVRISDERERAVYVRGEKDGGVSLVDGKKTALLNSEAVAALIRPATLQLR